MCKYFILTQKYEISNRKFHINAIVRLKDSDLLVIFFLSISDYRISM